MNIPNHEYIIGYQPIGNTPRLDGNNPPQGDKRKPNLPNWYLVEIAWNDVDSYITTPLTLHKTDNIQDVYDYIWCNVKDIDIFSCTLDINWSNNTGKSCSCYKTAQDHLRELINKKILVNSTDFIDYIFKQKEIVDKPTGTKYKVATGFDNLHGGFTLNAFLLKDVPEKEALRYFKK